MTRAARRRATKALAALVALAACLAVAAALGTPSRPSAGPGGLPMACGVGAVAVESGSMEPALPVGSLAIVQEQDGYAEGDVVAYASPPAGALVTHRISGFDGQGRVIARGDANNVDDPAFDPSLIEGRVVACVPLAGALAQSLRTPAGVAALLLIAAAALLYCLGRGAPGAAEGRRGRLPVDAFGETARLEG